MTITLLNSTPLNLLKSHTLETCINVSLTADSFLEHRVVQTSLQAVLMGTLCFVMADPVCAAIADGGMKEAVGALQAEIFGDGWVTIAKIAAAGVGVVTSVARSSLMPFGTGAAVAVGIHFFQKHTQSAAACLC